MHALVKCLAGGPVLFSTRPALLLSLPPRPRQDTVGRPGLGILPLLRCSWPGWPGSTQPATTTTTNNNRNTMQQSAMLHEIGELRTLLQRLRAHGQPRSAEVHDQALLQRFLNLRQAVKFSKGRGGRRAAAAAKIAERGGGVGGSGGSGHFAVPRTTSDVARRKLRNKKFTKYDGTSMEERRLMQGERTRRKMAEIEERKRQQEQAEMMNCSFQFKARPVPSSSSTQRLEKAKLRLSAMKGGDASVSLASTIRRIAAEHHADSKTGVDTVDLKSLFAKYCRVPALKRTSQSATMVRSFTARRTMDIHQFTALLRDFGLIQPPKLTTVRTTLIFQKFQNSKTKMIGYKEFAQAMEVVAVELGLTFEHLAARILDRQLAATEHMHFAGAETKVGGSVGGGGRGRSRGRSHGSHSRGSSIGSSSSSRGGGGGGGRGGASTSGRSRGGPADFSNGDDDAGGDGGGDGDTREGADAGGSGGGSSDSGSGSDGD